MIKEIELNCSPLTVYVSLMLITLKDGELNARSTTHNKWCFFIYVIVDGQFWMENYKLILKSFGTGHTLKSPTIFDKNF